jgi:SAM-dependent methyltransferase
MTDVVSDVKRYAAGAVNRVRRRATKGGAASPAPTEAPPLPATGVAHPLPDGCSDDEIRALMGTFRIDDSPPGSLDGYWNEAYGRFLHTWGLVRDAGEPGSTVLELGANPYFLTWLMTRFTDLDLSLANFFGSSTGELVQRLSVGEGSEQTELDMATRLFNMEEEPFPYDDGSFDVVLFCEIIEHLLMDPLHALAEINRVLRPDGRLVVTTPNVARLGNVLAMSSGGNLYDPYSGFGPYGRHNRE